MSISTKPAHSTPTSKEGGSTHAPVSPQKTAFARDQFVRLVVAMTWQLALAVLVPIIGCVLIGRATDNKLVWTLVGLGIALVASIAVLWRMLQTANRLPVPKLTAAEKRAVQQSYNEEDDN